MITEYISEPREITINMFNPDNLTLAMLSMAEFKTYSEKLGIPSELTQLAPFEMDYTEDSYLISIEKISTDIDINHDDKIYLFIKSKLLVIVDAEEETKEKFLKILPLGKNGYSIEKLTARFLSSLTVNNSKELDAIDDTIFRYEDMVLKDGKVDNMNNEILKIKRKLLNLRSFYEQLSDIADILIKNENGIFNGKKMKYLKDFEIVTDKLTFKTDMLRDSLVQLRDAYQSSLDLKLNNTMKLFTVIATIFLPLTLIAGWYGMNFKFMPELDWKYGYIYVIVLSIAISAGCIIYFKKKKLM